MNACPPEDSLQIDASAASFGLNWPGKAQARRAAWTDAGMRLREVADAGLHADTTRNLLIEGDNLDVLKLLRADHAGTVKLIYIDPPYNTGNPLLYNDDFRTPAPGGADAAHAPAWLRPHVAWLSMMYPRLLLARELLREDGLIFISIGDEELDSLTQIGREIFGDENFCGHLIWERKKKPSFLDARMGRVTEFIVCFARDRAKAPAFTAGAVTDGKKYPFNNAGNGVQVLTFPARAVSFGCGDGVIAPQDMSGGNIVTELLDAVEIRDGVNGNAFRLKGEWRYAQATLDALVTEGARITIRKAPFRPNLVSRSKARKKTASLLSYRTNGVPTNEDGTAEIRALFGTDIMPYPKPSGLIAYLVDMVTGEGDTVMDFFAGSGSTAHGLWRADIGAGLRRRFILVQSPEPTRQRRANGMWKTSPAFEAGYPTIFAITLERLRRTATALSGQLEAHSGPTTESAGADLGFRVLQVAGGES
ncbi:adenine-specific DNA-methyltransferase [Pseudochelatococcus lubricantis]|uniref:site-specific DNA-methyltransferase (adenine-specific) n=1 Tax=Pseudochelatococcus lubricantis TaxID=1538102 RepID=A0ABX0V892_9HYPH|nr:adenine-specific DNA-methyltransferase [Pseudochelatococcus lubricantis]